MLLIAISNWNTNSNIIRTVFCIPELLIHCWIISDFLNYDTKILKGTFCYSCHISYQNNVVNCGEVLYTANQILFSSAGNPGTVLSALINMNKINPVIKCSQSSKNTRCQTVTNMKQNWYYIKYNIRSTIYICKIEEVNSVTKYSTGIKNSKI